MSKIFLIYLLPLCVSLAVSNAALANFDAARNANSTGEAVAAPPPKSASRLILAKQYKAVRAGCRIVEKPVLVMTTQVTCDFKGVCMPRQVQVQQIQRIEQCY